MKTKINGLYAIIDNTFSPTRTHTELARKVLLGGCKVIQLRMKNSKWDDVLATSKEILALKKDFEFTFIVNDHIDICGELKADGVHIGNNDATIKEARKQLKDKYLIGYSSHKMEEAVIAEKEGADYVAFGAIFPTRTKGPGHPVQGLEKLTELRSKITVPLVAIGGITRNNIDSVIDCGVDSVAMITALTMADDIVGETKWYTERFS